MKKHLGVVVEEALELIDAAADQMGKRWEVDRPLLFFFFGVVSEKK